LVVDCFLQLLVLFENVLFKNVGSGEQRSEEQRLLLLLWDAKSTLFTHAVNLHAERQPVVNSRTIGARLGTKLKEKIFKAIQARRPAVNKSIAAFNKCYADYISKFPNQMLSDFTGNLTYEAFAALPLDDKFWNDGLYFHSKAAWAVDPNVRAGINCVLILSRIQEEFQLISQELARAVGWAISHHNHLSNYIAYIENCECLFKILYLFQSCFFFSLDLPVPAS
jgi:hypothetical protein